MQAAEMLAALRRGTPLVAPSVATTPTWRAWVAVFPPVASDEQPGWRNPDLKLVWLVREWDPSYLTHDRCWAEDDGMRTLRRQRSTGEAQFWELMDQYGGRSQFTYPWHTDYPG